MACAGAEIVHPSKAGIAGKTNHSCSYPSQYLSFSPDFHIQGRGMEPSLMLGGSPWQHTASQRQGNILHPDSLAIRFRNSSALYCGQAVLGLSME